MSLHYKIPFILLFVISTYALLSYGILTGWVSPRFIALEKREARKDMMRCMEALRREIFHLDTVTHDWAAWDDMYNFISDPSEKFIKSNLIPQTFLDNQINMIGIYNKEKQIVWGEAWDTDNEKKIEINNIFPHRENDTNIFFQLLNTKSAVSEIFLTVKGPIIVSSRPIIKSDHQGPIRGYFIMGKFLNKKMVISLNERTQVEHEIFPVFSMDSGDDCGMVKDRVIINDSVVFETINDKLLYAYATFPDVNGQPQIMLKTSQPRDIRKSGGVTLWIAFLLICFSGLVIISVLFLLLRRIVIQPLSVLTEYVTKIQSSDTLQPLKLEGRYDEIGRMGREFLHMVDRIQKGHMKINKINKKLKEEIVKRQCTERKLLKNQAKLRELASDRLLSEENERRQIATDLHDRIGQSLALVQIKLDSLVQTHPDCCTVKYIEEITVFMENIIQDTRTLIFDISPPVLYEVGLEAAIEWLAEDLNKKHDVYISVKGDGGILNTSLKVSYYRSVRELLYNIVKHAKARSAFVTIEREGLGLVVEVTDDGQGVDLKDIENDKTKKGFGLFSIRERQRSLGGTIEIDSSPGKGTRIKLRTPTINPF